MSTKIVKQVRRAYNEGTKNLDFRSDFTESLSEFCLAVETIGEYNNFQPNELTDDLKDSAISSHFKSGQVLREGSPALRIRTKGMGSAKILSVVLRANKADYVQIESDHTVYAWWD